MARFARFATGAAALAVLAGGLTAGPAVAAAPAAAATTGSAAATSHSAVNGAGAPTTGTSTTAAVSGSTKASHPTAAPGTASGTATLNTPEHEIVFGAESQNSTALAAHENLAGRKMNAVRLYRFWGQPLYQNVPPETSGSDEMAMAQGGRLLIVSMRAQYANGTDIPWSEVAAASATSTGTELTLYDNIVTMAQQIQQFQNICVNGGSFAGATWPATSATNPGCQAYFTFNHEPEAAPAHPDGNGSEFIAAWQNIWNVFKSNGVCSVSDPSPSAACLASGTYIKYVWITTAYGYARTDQYNVIKYYYPGDGYVDIIAADAYNWYTCHNNPWTEMSSIISAMRAFGLQHPTKPLMLAEWNSVEDPNAVGTHKAQWINNVENLFTQPGYQQYWAVLNWGESTGGSCQFGYNSSTQAAAAWKQMGADPAYQGTTIPQLLPFTVSGTMTEGGSTATWSSSASLPNGSAYGGTLPNLSCELVNPNGGADLQVTASLPAGTYQIDPTTCQSGEPQITNPATGTTATDPNYAVADYQSGGFTVNGPAVSISTPTAGSTVSGTAVSVSGTTTETSTTTSPATVSQVQVSVDGNPVTTTGTTSWSASLDSTQLTNGPHTLTVTATDTNSVTGTATETFYVGNLAGTSCPATPSGTTQLSGNVSLEGSQGGWTGVYNARTALARVEPPHGSYDGLWALQIAPKPGDSGIVGASNAAPVWVTSTTAGTTYTASAYVAGSVSGESVSLILREVTTTGALVSKAATTQTLADTGWHQLTLPYTARNSGDVLHYYLVANNLASSSQNLLADCLSLTQPSTTGGARSVCPSSPSGATELSGNVSLETTQKGWTAPYNAKSALARVEPPGGSYDGQWALQIAPKSGDSGVVGASNGAPDWVTSTTAGTSYTASAYVAGSVSSESVSLILRESTTGGALVGRAVSRQTLPDTGWHQITARYTAQRSGDVLHYYLVANNLGSSSQHLLGDCLSLTKPS
jgi:beta-mannanase